MTLCGASTVTKTTKLNKLLLLEMKPVQNVNLKFKSVKCINWAWDKEETRHETVTKRAIYENKERNDSKEVFYLSAVERVANNIKWRRWTPNNKWRQRKRSNALSHFPFPISSNAKLVNCKRNIQNIKWRKCEMKESEGGEGGCEKLKKRRIENPTVD